MYFLIEDNDLFDKFSTICDKSKADIKTEFDNKLAHNKKKKKKKKIKNQNKILQ